MSRPRAAGPLRFCFVLHLHQPVGNFDFVFREHADDVYGPFLDFLEDRELWPVGLHVSGPLLEWLGEHDRRLHDRLGRHVADGRVELLSAGWYEPILVSLPRADRAQQLGRMREELVSRFGVEPAGAWLTERAWETEVAADLAEAGLRYVLVDDHLLRRAGVADADLHHPVRTESDGHMLDLLPIDERLRYLIPFRPAEQIEEELRNRHERGEPLALIGDDGEKFGGWPRTRAWLYEGGWLEAFGDAMDRLRGDGAVRWVSPTEALDEVEVRGPVYPPSGSYPEMESWAPGAHWRGFLSRYPEANRIHKRMLALSALCRERGDPPDVRRSIARAQCNDAYWHGVFGGLYMKHLREGVRGALLDAERVLRRGEPLSWTRSDVDADGHDEWWVHGAGVSAWVRDDGAVSDLLWLEGGVDVLDVLTRVRETYHEEAVAREAPEPTPEKAEGDTVSIHDIEAQATLDALPPVDPQTRVLVADRILAPSIDFDRYRAGDVGEGLLDRSTTTQGDAPRRLRGGRGEALEWTFETRSGPQVTRALTIHEDGAVELEWRWRPDDFPPDAVFAPELSVGAPVTVDEEVPVGEKMPVGEAPAVLVRLDPPTEVWRYPIVTTSKCPDGFEEIEQGTSITPRWGAGRGRASLLIRPSGG
jgi:alpha-amylase